MHLKSLSLLLLLVLYTLASDESSSLVISPQAQDSSSSSAINFLQEDAGNINDLVAPGGWTTAASDLGNTGDNPINQQQEEFLPTNDDTVVACADPAPSQDGNPPASGIKRRRFRRLHRKRDPSGFCKSEDYYQNSNLVPPSPPSGGTTTTTNRKPGRRPGMTQPPVQPIRVPKVMPLLGDPNSPLCNQYFPGLGSNYAVCYYPYFKTILRSPLVHMLSPSRACKYIRSFTSFPREDEKKALMRELLYLPGSLEIPHTHTHTRSHSHPSQKKNPSLSIIRYEIDHFVSLSLFSHIDSFGDPCTPSEELWCCGTTWPRPPDTFQQLNPQVSKRKPPHMYFIRSRLPHSNKKPHPALLKPTPTPPRPLPSKKHSYFPCPNNLWDNTAGHTLFNRRIRLPPC